MNEQSVIVWLWICPRPFVFVFGLRMGVAENMSDTKIMERFQVLSVPQQSTVLWEINFLVLHVVYRRKCISTSVMPVNLWSVPHCLWAATGISTTICVYRTRRRGSVPGRSEPANNSALSESTVLGGPTAIFIHFPQAGSLRGIISKEEAQTKHRDIPRHRRNGLGSVL